MANSYTHSSDASSLEKLVYLTTSVPINFKFHNFSLEILISFSWNITCALLERRVQFADHSRCMAVIAILVYVTVSGQCGSVSLVYIVGVMALVTVVVCGLLLGMLWLCRTPSGSLLFSVMRNLHLSAGFNSFTFLMLSWSVLSNLKSLSVYYNLLTELFGMGGSAYGSGRGGDEGCGNGKGGDSGNGGDGIGGGSGKGIWGGDVKTPWR
ncbi:hypothetical protein Tco_1253658 [Tanacetum coccineum]